MRGRIFLFLGISAAIIYSCSNQGGRKDQNRMDNLIVQSDDGTISLKLEHAVCYNDEVNPSSNTAEWNVVVSQPGRYKVWLSSATKDTIDLSYANPVKVTMLDSRLDVSPEVDVIVRNSADVSYPYYRADSYMGSFFISEPGEYSIQVISEKVISKDAKDNTSSSLNNTRLMSVNLTPITR